MTTILVELDNIGSAIQVTLLFESATGLWTATGTAYLPPGELPWFIPERRSRPVALDLTHCIGISRSPIVLRSSSAKIGGRRERTATASGHPASIPRD